MVTDNAMELIADGGVAALTFKAMSARIGCSSQAVHQWYGSRDQLVVVVAATFCQRWGQWVWGRGYERALTALLPDDEEELRWTRVLLAIEEQARLQADLAPMLADLRESERQVMMRLFPRAAGPSGEGGEELRTLTLVVAGLRAALCRADAPCTVGEARTTLLEVQARLAGPLADWVSRSAPGRPSSSLD
jgi:AcrR family transcriptional regulator